MFQKLELFMPSAVSLHSPEDRNRSDFQNVVVSSCLELRTVGNAQKPTDSECYTPSSEPFRIPLKMSVNGTF
jgi:Ulp1 family protease